MRNETGRICVALVISNLEHGGAQRQVVELANQLNSSGVETHLCSLSNYVPLAGGLNQATRYLHVVAKRAKYDLTVVTRLVRLLNDIGPDIVHTFLFDAEIAGRLAGRHIKGAAVIGSERNTDYKLKWLHHLTLRLTGHCFDAIIANSHAGKRFQTHMLNIPENRLFVVHNGVNVQKFAPAGAGSLRDELNIPRRAIIVGMFCSFKKQKNHPMFFRMARRVLDMHPQARFLCVGDELHSGLQESDQYRAQMSDMIKSLGLSDMVMCLGNRDDVAKVYNLCDVTVLTSRREGTPNVVLESMACEVPVVVTDVADNAAIVPDGQAGYVVPYDDDQAMADRVVGLLADEKQRRAMGKAARNWVESHFSLSSLADKTIDVYHKVLRRKASAGLSLSPSKSGDSVSCG